MEGWTLAGDALKGRFAERTAIEVMLRHTRRSHGGGVFLHGEPGIGKTALLEYTIERAGDMRVLASAGAEPESELGYAALHRLLLPILDEVERLPGPQARALGVVFGHLTGATPDRFLVSLAALSLLSQVAERQPLLCVVDDVHWADRLSVDTLTFLSRRLGAESIAVAVAARSVGDRARGFPGLVDLPLTSLDSDSARALLAEHAGDRFTSAERTALLRATAGNPLAIRELLTEEPRAVLSGAPLPLTVALHEVFYERARQRDPAVWRLLLLIACDGRCRLDALRRAATHFSGSISALLSGELEELVTADVEEVRFRHPLIRSAVYYGASVNQRRAAHQAWATILAGDPQELERRSWHLGQAADEPDESIAAELAGAAARLSHRAGPASAAPVLTRAAELTVSNQRRAPRLVAAAAAWWDSGAPSRSTTLLAEAEHLAVDSPALLRDIACLRAMMEMRAGNPVVATDLLLPLLPDALHADLDGATELLMLFAKLSFDANSSRGWERVLTAIEGLSLEGTETHEVMARTARAALRVWAGAEPGLLPGDLDALEQLDQPVSLAVVGGLLRGIGHVDRAIRLRHKAVRIARTTGAAGVLAGVLDGVVSEELDRSQFSVAAAYAQEGYQLAVEARQSNTACCHQSWLALLAAIRGRDDETEQLAEEVITEASARELVRPEIAARRALGLRHLIAGDPTTAMSQLAVTSRSGSHPLLVLSAAPDLIEAAVRAEEPDRAAEAFREFSRWAEPKHAPHGSAIAARCRALLATGDTVESEFTLALQRHAQSDSPFEEARTRLLFGQYLRRERRRSDARTHLRAALDTFHRVGAAPWAAVAREELRATGLADQAPAPHRLRVLTPQETRIALAVSSGTTNREIAAQLFLSPRTVDYHLSKIFQKLGVRSRAELVNVILTEQRQAGDPRHSNGAG